MAAAIRPKKSNPANRAKSYASVCAKVLPIVDLSPIEMARFNMLVEAREAETWTDSDLDLVTKAAQVSVELDRLWIEYKKEGPMIDTESGSKVKNPILRCYESLSTLYKSQRTSLGLNASQRGISGHKQKGRNEQDTNARKKLSSIGSLIARPR